MYIEKCREDEREGGREEKRRGERRESQIIEGADLSEEVEGVYTLGQLLFA